MMKRSRYLWLFVFLPLLFCQCTSSSSPPLTVSINIPTSDAQQAPATIEPVHTIVLDFSEPLDAATVSGRIGFHVIRTGDIPTAPERAVQIAVDAGAPQRVTIKTASGEKLLSGELYRITIGRGIRSVGGNETTQDFVHFFATDYDFTPLTLPELAQERSVIVVISDIHLGDARSIGEGYGWFIQNRDRLIGFLNLVRQRSDIKELVIAGDLFDEWVAPMGHETFDGTDQSGFVDRIAEANRPVIGAINDIIQDALIRVTYVPGNHDMLVESRDIQRIFPGIFEARDAQGLGAYTPDGQPEIVIEHGHRYDFFNAPDMLSNRSITQSDSILSPGFFVSKIAATSDMEHQRSSFYREDLSGTTAIEGDHYYLSYWAAWQLIMAKKPVRENWDDRLIKTGIDGYREAYAINDLIPRHQSEAVPLDVNLFKEIRENWGQRQQHNRVSVPILAEIAIAAGALNPALDAQSVVQYFLNPKSGKRIVVFGHTHKAGLFTALNHQAHWSVYANSGTWVDNGDPSCTFIAVIPQKSNGAVTDTVTVYQYLDDGNIKRLKSAAIKK